VAGKLRAELHHWWPKSLSSFWADDRGCVHQLTPDGKAVASPPKQFGAIRNDNQIRFADRPTIWDESFEHTFQMADDNFAGIVRWLQTLSSSILARDTPFAARLTPLTLSRDRQMLLAECLASLIVRSPSLRHRIRLTTEYYRERIGLRDPTARHSLIAASVRGGQRVLARAMATRGKFAVLFAGEAEFVFGDGFLHNIHDVANAPMNPCCLVPLTPEIAVLYVAPSQYRTYPKAFVVNLTLSEVGFVNDMVQIYAKRYLYFRNIYPVIHSAFQRDEHLEFEYDRHSWITALEQTMAEACFEEWRSAPRDNGK
jgi:hypothetical protein